MTHHRVPLGHWDALPAKNANVRFMQAETHRRFFEMMRSFGIHVRSFRADCGSYSEDIVKMVMEHTDKFYIRAERHAGLYETVQRLHD